MRVFLDTNILISAILFPGSRVADFLRVAIERHTMVLSSFVLEELYEVFGQKFAENILDLEEFLNDFAYDLIHTPRNIDSGKYPEIRDIDDLPIIASAILGDCDFLVTGDKDVLSVRLERPRILSPAEFMDMGDDDMFEDPGE